MKGMQATRPRADGTPPQDHLAGERTTRNQKRESPSTTLASRALRRPHMKAVPLRLTSKAAMSGGFSFKASPMPMTCNSNATKGEVNVLTTPTNTSPAAGTMGEGGGVTEGTTCQAVETRPHEPTEEASMTRQSQPCMSEKSSVKRLGQPETR
jgi:hypothetical protein